MSTDDPADHNRNLYVGLGSPVLIGETLACVHLLSELLPLLLRLGARSADQLEKTLDDSSLAVKTRLLDFAKEYEHANTDEAQRVADEVMELWRARLHRG